MTYTLYVVLIMLSGASETYKFEAESFELCLSMGESKASYFEYEKRPLVKSVVIQCQKREEKDK